MKFIDDTVRIKIFENKLKIQVVTDYAGIAVLLMIIGFLLAFEFFIWSIIPLAFIITLLLHRFEVIFDYNTNKIISYNRIAKWKYKLNKEFSFKDINKIRIIGKLSDPDGDPDLRRPFCYDYYLLTNIIEYKISLSVDSLITVNRLNNLINSFEHKFKFEIDESEISEVKRIWYGK